MSELSNAIAKICELYGDMCRGLAQREFRIVEERAETPVDAKGRLILRRDALVQPAAYEQRFNDLLRTGYAWLHLTCVGIDQEAVVIVVRVPAATSQKGGAVRTSINYSGPSVRVQEHRWDASEDIAFVE